MSGSPKYEAVIGLEIHVQLATKSKMFCGCDNQSDGVAPNTNTCPVCLGMPGTLPVPNRQAIEWSIKTARALGCTVPEVSKFDRKQYFYPDLPKGYQISQFDEPIGGPGTFEFDLAGPDGSITPKSIRITRLHLEEDAGKLTHPPGAAHSLVDLNRAGTPLMEIVTEPDFRSPAEARVFLQELRQLVRSLGVSEAEMQKGHLRADANISLRPVGQEELGTKTELKNLNSFKFVEKGLLSEIARQTKLLDEGKQIDQETRGFVEATGKTVSQRGKEEAHDYRYFPEPDLPPLEPGQLEGAEELPELPIATKRRWRKLGVPEQVITVAIKERQVADQFDRVIEKAKHPKEIALRWNDLRDSEQFAEQPERLAELLQAVDAAGVTSAQQVSSVVTQLAEGAEVKAAIEAAGATEQTDLGPAIDEAIKANPKAVEDFKSGNPNALNVMVGFVMKQTKGSANPTSVLDALKQKLE